MLIHTGGFSPFVPGQELEVRYPDLGNVPHRGIVRYVFWNGYKWDVRVAHNSKTSRGVGIVSVEQFAQGNPIKVLRTPSSGEQQNVILQRVDSAIAAGVRYYLLVGNCEHFSTWCYTGAAESPSLQTAAAILAGVVMAAAWMHD